MGVEYNAVSCRDHTDGVTNYGFGGVCAGGDRANYSKRSHLHKGKSVVTCLCLGNDILSSGGLFCNENVLESLVVNSTHACLSNADLSHNGSFCKGKTADLSDYLLSLLNCHRAYRTVSALCRIYCLVHIGIDTYKFSSRIFCGRVVLSGTLCAFYYAFYYFSDLSFCNICHCKVPSLVYLLASL